MDSAYKRDNNKLTNYPSNRDERENIKGRRPGFKKDRRREYKDLDEPEGNQT